MGAPGISVVIPAHNEIQTLPHCLQSLLRQDRPEGLDVIVIANGCNDDTAAAASSFASEFSQIEARLQVVSLDVANKSAALNAGDLQVEGDITIYLDADTTLSTNAISELSEILSAPAARLASPRLILRLPEKGMSRRHGRVWQALPPVCDDVVGAGCYAVNKLGRQRWRIFPPVIADDEFVRRQFKRGERMLTPSATFMTTHPSSSYILPMLARWRQGNLQLDKLGVSEQDNGLLARRLTVLLTNPRLWSSLPSPNNA
jgi:glycosyltransferase involved in cell wall biosynthesis